MQRVEDFLCGRTSAAFGEVLPSYAAGTAMGELGAILPACVASSLRAALTDMDRRLRGFAHPDALLTGVETRFSSPVRILRGPTLESVSAAGVYPCGEGLRLFGRHHQFRRGRHPRRGGDLRQIRRARRSERPVIFGSAPFAPVDPGIR